MVTRHDIISRAKVKHQHKYSYGKFGDVSVGKKIPIVCQRHGEFFQTVGNHAYKGTGCPGCKRELLSRERKRPTCEFIQKATLIHDSKYDYSQVKYVNTHSVVSIICALHGTFLQTPNNHIINKQGCPTCGKRPYIDTHSFIQRAQNKYGDLFDYSNVEYINAHTCVSIKCAIHGRFQQQPDSHINSKHGCPMCGRGHVHGRYNTKVFERKPELMNKPAYLYLVELCNGTERFLKIGICTTTIEDRFKSIVGVGYNYKKVVIKEDTLKRCFDLEQDILASSVLKQIIPEIKFDGYTECISIDHKQQLIEDLTQ